MMNSKELPKQFKSWVHFYDSIKPYELGGYQVVKIEVRPIIHHLDSAPHLDDIPKKELDFEISYIKNKALDELLNNRFDVSEIDNTLSMLKVIKNDSFNRYPWQIEQIEKIERTVKSLIKYNK